MKLLKWKQNDIFDNLALNLKMNQHGMANKNKQSVDKN